MGEKFLLPKPIKFGLNRKRILCWSVFAIEPIAGFCPFMGYLPSKNVSRDHDIEDEFVSLGKPIVLCTIRKRILCWSILALELFGLLNFKEWVMWPWWKGEFASNAKPIVTYAWILTSRPFKERLLTSCFQYLQKLNITHSNTDGFTLQYSLCRF